mgnify:CR=1 FL=1
MEKFSKLMENTFKLRENGTTVKTEIIAGVTTFMTMAYILAVNPNILSSTGMDHGAVFTATALAAFLGTLLMALFANYPFALAPGMGLNAYFAYTAVLGYGYSWQAALTAVFAEGIIFIVLSLTNVREAIFNSIPVSLKSAVSVASVCSSHSSDFRMQKLYCRTLQPWQASIPCLPTMPTCSLQPH